jgi:putative ubiquitin-RnfH superfamily antitoxin RatB of RatAB toxin-antitoxin module
VSRPLKRCSVAYATAERQFLWTVEIEAGASIAEVIAAARRVAPEAAVPWESAPVGIFGELCERNAVPADGDRIELYRPLEQDPRARRRAQLRPPRR